MRVLLVIRMENLKKITNAQNQDTKLYYAYKKEFN